MATFASTWTRTLTSRPIWAPTCRAFWQVFLACSLAALESAVQPTCTWMSRSHLGLFLLLSDSVKELVLSSHHSHHFSFFICIIAFHCVYILFSQSVGQISQIAQDVSGAFGDSRWSMKAERPYVPKDTGQLVSNRLMSHGS